MGRVGVGIGWAGLPKGMCLDNTKKNERGLTLCTHACMMTDRVRVGMISVIKSREHSASSRTPTRRLV